ncbi:hypothetical protein [Halopiger xanaduensis]|uniref:Uncharacterized protein n=1 Tax=Halopiger xanaduensis (strain DSM 18323 / JCM 14033 / SH-6) TaxID=797210 RepID=F8DCB1_HALXS|nr:hypothetical protein [Halopiger xanaduensis]AEH38368.1 hypothetical protein Halxa_3762 [Halopiger xanaduensis SH-6]
MTDRTRYEAALENGTLYLEDDDARIEIGPMDAVVELIGGETYTLEYDDRQSAAAWLPTDDDNTITIDVRDSVLDWAYTEDFTTNVGNSPLEQTGDSGYPIRTEVFADMVTSIWDSKGHMEA